MGRQHFSIRFVQVASACWLLLACGGSSKGGVQGELPNSSAANDLGHTAASGRAGNAMEASVAGRVETRSSAGAKAGNDAAGAGANALRTAPVAGTASPSSAGSGVTPAAGMGGMAGVDAPVMNQAGMPAAGAVAMNIAGMPASAGNAGVPAAGAPTKWPVAMDGWPEATPKDVGLDKTQLDSLGDALQRASGGTRSGLVVVKEGALVYEKYWDGDAATMHQVFSCTKSWGSTLIGIAVRKGMLTVDDPVTKWIPQPAREVGTGAIIKHLLTHTAHTTPPGTAFSYNSGSIINTLPEILEATSGMSSHAFFQSFLAQPLKLTMQWPTCPQGGCAGTRYKADYIQFGDQGPNAVLKSTIRDQAKLGLLWLDDGVWNGERLLDTAYIKAATEPSFDFQAVYGYLWWLNREGRSSVLSYNAQVPKDMYHAVGGVGNCSIAVLPTQRMVIVHVGALDAGGLGGHWEVFAPLFKP